MRRSIMRVRKEDENEQYDGNKGRWEDVRWE